MLVCRDVGTTRGVAIIIPSLNCNVWPIRCWPRLRLDRGQPRQARDDNRYQFHQWRLPVSEIGASCADRSSPILNFGLWRYPTPAYILNPIMPNDRNSCPVRRPRFMRANNTGFVLRYCLVQTSSISVTDVICDGRGALVSDPVHRATA